MFALVRLSEEPSGVAMNELVETACLKLEEAGFEVITEDEKGESILPRPRKPKN